MIDSTLLKTAEKLKKTADATYLVFKKNPTTDNVRAWTLASNTFNDYCVKLITDLIIEETNKKEEILANVDKYKKCNKCGAELIYLTDKDNFVAHSDFVEDFPGWCYKCLLEHCTTHECEGCTVTTRPFNCSFEEVKKLHL